MDPGGLPPGGKGLKAGSGPARASDRGARPAAGTAPTAAGAAEGEGRGSEPASAPARSRAETRRRLLRAGIELFAREGLHAATTARIARAAGVATGTFYLHFRDKHELFAAVVRDALARMRARTEAAAAAAPPDPLEQMRARTRELLAFAAENRSLGRVLLGPDAGQAGLAELVFDDMVPGVEKGLRSRLETGGVSGLHPEVAAQALVAMWVRVIAWWLEDPERVAREAVVETLVCLHPASRSRF